MNNPNTNGSVKNDNLWRRAEKDMLRRERRRLIQRGFISAAPFMKPQLMVRNPDVKGGWSPHIGQNIR